MVLGGGPLLEQQLAAPVEDERREGPVQTPLLMHRQLLAGAHLGAAFVDQDDVVHDRPSVLSLAGREPGADPPPEDTLCSAKPVLPVDDRADVVNRVSCRRAPLMSHPDPVGFAIVAPA